MRTKIVILFCTLLALSAQAGDIEKLSISYEYVSNQQGESPDQARRTAIQHAKAKALEEKFGLDVSAVNTILQKSRVEGDKASGSTDVFSLRETSVRGEWIETIREDILEQTFVNGFWRVKVYLVGKARNHDKPKTNIHYAFVNNDHDKINRDQYQDGDDIFLRFSSPAKGSLCVYLVDEEQTAYCLLPYAQTQSGCQEIIANQEYLFFSSDTDNSADEYTLNTQHSAENNTLYIIFTPHKLTKASDKKSGKNWRQEQMPRQLPYKEFIAWLAKNQTSDPEMVVKTEIITIRK